VLITHNWDQIRRRCGTTSASSAPTSLARAVTTDLSNPPPNYTACQRHGCKPLSHDRTDTKILPTQSDKNRVGGEPTWLGIELGDFPPWVFADKYAPTGEYPHENLGLLGSVLLSGSGFSRELDRLGLAGSCQILPPWASAKSSQEQKTSIKFGRCCCQSRLIIQIAFLFACPLPGSQFAIGRSLPQVGPLGTNPCFAHPRNGPLHLTEKTPFSPRRFSLRREPK
jgi:hypothetical protein